MSTQAVSWAYAQTPHLTPSAAAILANLAHRARAGAASCWPSQARIVADTGLSRATVNRALAVLERKNLITRRQRKGRSTVYELVGCKEGEKPVYRANLSHHETPPVSPCDIEQEQNKKQSRKAKAALAKKPPTQWTPSEVELKAADIVKQQTEKYAGLADEEIVYLPVPASGKLPTKAVVDVWRRAHGKYQPGVFLASMTLAMEGQLASAAKRVGATAYGAAVLAVMRDWPGFAAQCKGVAGAFKTPSLPQVGFFLKFIEVAVNYSLKATTEASAAGKPLQSIANPPKTVAPPLVVEVPAKLGLDDLKDLFDED